MPANSVKLTRKLGAGPVFFTAISTILGAIMFLRFGYAVGHVGLYGTMAVVILGHMITIPTAMAISEIATNHRVEGGGEYYIISRSFGLQVGAAIGIALYLSQAISVAFYLIAFAEAFRPILGILQEHTGIMLNDFRLISLPCLGFLIMIIYFRGASFAASLLYFIVFILFITLLLFFLGEGTPTTSNQAIYRFGPEDGDSFFIVFAIIFPAFTGMTAGVGLSGDLKNPRRSIPLGTLGATLLGMVVYLFVIYKLANSANQVALSSDPLVMQDIALWGPIIPIGLACATISSALGSIMVAPRTLQALAHDGIFVRKTLNQRLAKSHPRTGEPVGALLITSVIAAIFIIIGDVNTVAQIITMFFMVTYGSLCLISFLEHFAADPAYRPTFKSRWYISLPGALLCFAMMFKINALFAGLALTMMTLLYILIARTQPDEEGLASLIQGALFQVARRLQILLQKNEDRSTHHWRPFLIGLSASSFERYDMIELLRWVSHKYGFGTYIHFIKEYLSKQTRDESDQALDRLVRIANASGSNVYFSTLVSPSYTTAIAQVLQLPGISGQKNNMILFEFERENPEGLSDIIDNFPLVKAKDFDILILGSCARSFGYRREIHIWITRNDYENANLMILLGYILLGHSAWDGGLIKIFDICPPERMDEESIRLADLVKAGRLPIATHHIQLVEGHPEKSVRDWVNIKSCEADLVILGLREEMLKHQNGSEVFHGFDDVGNILFVNTTSEREI